MFNLGIKTLSISLLKSLCAASNMLKQTKRLLPCNYRKGIKDISKN